MTAEDKYSLRNSDNLREAFQMEISKILKTFTLQFAQLVQSLSNSKYFEKKDDRCSVCIFEVTDCEKHIDANI